jgi:hypothetical protein
MKAVMIPRKTRMGILRLKIKLASLVHMLFYSGIGPKVQTIEGMTKRALSSFNSAIPSFEDLPFVPVTPALFPVGFGSTK